MDFSYSDDQQAIIQAIRDICSSFDNSYWSRIEGNGEYPADFVKTLTDLGWLSVLIPEEYGGGGLGMSEASIILEEIHRSGGNANACHAQMYTMGAILKHGSLAQKSRWLPKIASGELRLQAFAVTEPDAGSDSKRIKTAAVRDGNAYVITGQKVFISRVEYSDLMLLLARTSLNNLDGVNATEGLSLFLIDLRETKGSMTLKRIPLMFNHHTYQVFFDDLRVPADNLIGTEGMGFRHVIDGWNAERILIASEAIGDARFFVEKASAYASERVVFNAAIGSNQGIQFPLAEAYALAESASLMRIKAAKLFDDGDPCGKESNMAKLLASNASWAAANAAMATYGGYGFASEYGIERKFREAKLLQIAPVSNNLILAYLAHNVLGMPRSY